VVAILILGVCGTLLAGSAAAAGVTIDVNTTSDSPSGSQCSLREAFLYANGTAEPACATSAPTGTITIKVPAGCYKLTGGRLSLTGSNPIVVDGAGPGPAACNGTGTVIDADGNSAVLVDGNTASTMVEGVTITGGNAGNATCSGYGCDGGGMVDAGATMMTLDDVTVAGNDAGGGQTGGNAPDGGDGGNGGGIYDLGGDLTIENSTISGNDAGDGGLGTTTPSLGGVGGSGGGIYDDGGTISILDSTIVGNSAGNGGAATTTPTGPGAGGGGGGIAINDVGSPSVSITNVTMYGNDAGAGGEGVGIPIGPSGTSGDGGAIYGPVTVNYSTIAGNQISEGGQGTAIDSPSGAEPITASIIADNGSSDQSGCATSGLIPNGGYDIVYPAGTGCPGEVENPDLGPLQVNGGPYPLQTLALLAESPAIDVVPASPSCPSTDERGVTRPQGGACDVGAYEWAPPVLSSVSARAVSSTSAQVQATVQPNLQATTVVVSYGATKSYGTATAPITAGSGSTPVAVTVPIAGLTPGSTYQAELVGTNADGATSSQNLTFTTPSAAPPAPRLSRLRESARSWLAGKAPARISAAASHVSTTFSFTLNEAATVTFAFSQNTLGRKVSKRCVKLTKSNRHKPRCVLVSGAGTLSLAARAGSDQVHFDGAIPHHRTLGAGSYTVAVYATSSSGRTGTSKLSFTVLKPPRRKHH
jgi:hypothetical protein